jgi:hypothetical protein
MIGGIFMAVDIYSPLFQLQSIKKMKPISRILTEMFLVEGRAVPQEIAIWDVKKGQNRMAPFVHKNAGGVVTGRTGFATEKIEFPKIAPERVVEMENIDSRMFGENLISERTPEQRALELIAEDLNDLRDMIACTKEWMVSQVLFQGKLDLLIYVDGGRVVAAPDWVDFGFTNNFTPTKPWDEAGSDVLGDMKAMHQTVLLGQGSVDIILMAADVSAALLSNEAYLKKLDTLNFAAGRIEQSFKGDSLLYMGVNHLGVPMYEYSGTVMDYTGNNVKLIPDGKMLMGSRNMLKSLYGPITQVENVNASAKTYLEKEVPLRYSDIGSNSTKQRLTSRPVIIPNNVDGWVVGSVL